MSKKRNKKTSNRSEWNIVDTNDSKYIFSIRESDLVRPVSPERREEIKRLKDVCEWVIGDECSVEAPAPFTHEGATYILKFKADD